MEQFNPDIRLVAVDSDDVVVTFDSGIYEDKARAPKAIRFPRRFSELGILVSDFTSPGSSGSRKEYHGQIVLTVTGADGTTEHVLAKPVLWLESTGRNHRKNADPFNFHSPEDVTDALRNGVATALTRALVAFYGREAQVDSAARQPAHALSAASAIRADAGPAAAATAAWFPEAPAANQPAPTPRSGVKPNLVGRRVLAAFAGVAVVVGAVWATSHRQRDPIHEAVSRAMSQDPASTQAQVELTKETLKQMGLDPGKSGDVGCLAPQ